MKSTAELKLQIAELKREMEFAKIKEAKIQKQQESKMSKVLAQAYKDLKTEILDGVKIESNILKIDVIFGIQNNWF